MPKVSANAKVAIVEALLLRILAEFRMNGINKIPKEFLCRLTGYTSTSSKTWSTAFKNSKNLDTIKIETRNGETSVEMKQVQRMNPKTLRPKEIEALLRKYSKQLQIQQTTFDVFEVLLRLGPRHFITYEDLAKGVNKNIATKSLMDAPKLLNSFALIDKRGRGKTASYRLTQSMFDNDENETVPCSVAASGGAVSAEEISDEWLTCEEDTQTEGIDIPLEGKHVPFHCNQQSQIMAQAIETYVPFAVQEDGTINGGGYQYEAEANNGNSSDRSELEYIINV